MKYWNDNGPKQAIRDNNYGGGRLTFGLYNAGKFYFNKLNKRQRRAVAKYFSTLCIDCYGKPYMCENINNAIDFGCAMAATGNIPIIGSYVPWKYKDVYLWDGGMNAKTCYVDTDQTLLFTFNNRGTHQRVIDLSKWVAFYPTQSLSPSFYSQQDALDNADMLFQYGYDDAKQNETEILRHFRDIGIKWYS
jgi:hypothetical protein